MINYINQKTIKVITVLYVALSCSLVYAGYWSAENSKNKALVIVPVADTTTKSLATCVYDAMPCGPGKDLSVCNRVHQLLFNEVVTVNQECGEEVQCTLDAAFYQGPERKHISTFWTLKKNIRLLQEFDNLEAIPQPYAQNCRALVENQDTQNSVILTVFWHDKITQKIYSAGTRFVGKPELDSEQGYAVLMLTDTGFTKLSWVPSTHAVRGYAHTPEERVQRFLQVLKQWAQLDSIAYIWGGCSLTKLYNAQEFRSVIIEQNGKKSMCWVRPDTTKPYSGFDCSGLILRAAQIAGLPYFFKNTTTLSTCLQELGENDILQEGDLIYYPGHVLIVSDLLNNLIIESAGYSSGYGKVHCISLHKVFENVYTYADLLALYHARVPIKRLKRDTSQAGELKGCCKLLKIRSIFDV